MTNKILSFCAFIIGTLMMTSCLGNGNDNVTSQSFTYNQNLCFNSVTDIQEGTTYITTGTIYRLNYDYSSAKASVEINGLKLSDSDKDITLKFDNLPMTTDNGWVVAKGSNLIPTGGNLNYEFKDLSVRYIVRGNMYSFCINYTVNNRYHVCVIPVQSLYFGNTYTTPVGESQLGTYSTRDTYYVVTLDPEKQKAVIAVAGAKFSDKMPITMNFLLKDLPFTINGYGYEIKADGPINPETENNVPNTKYPISNIVCNASITSGGSLSYKCEANNMGTFSVNASLEYVLKDNTSTTN
ncbi:MAG: hypothetical protein K2G92_08560 [Duncaniella sp.]|nr:hypothetical protein [Duncaniella sp.]